MIESGLIEVRTSLETWKWFLKLYIDLLSLFSFRGKISRWWLSFDQRFRKYIQKRNFRRKNGLKRVYNEGDMIFASLTTKTIFWKFYLLSYDFQWAIWGVKLDLAIPNYQKYISMLSHDSGDIKNVENKIITTKIYTFQNRRNSIYFHQLFSKILLSIEKQFL